MEETLRSFASNVAYFHVNVCGLDIPARLADRPVYHMLTRRRFIVAIAAVSQLTLRHSSCRPAASDRSNLTFAIVDYSKYSCFEIDQPTFNKIINKESLIRSKLEQGKNR